MMKKMLVLALVLAVAGLANAGYVFQVNGADVANGATINVTGPVTITMKNLVEEAGVLETSFVGLKGGAISNVVLYPLNLVGTYVASDAGNIDLETGKGTMPTWVIENTAPAVGKYKVGPLFDVIANAAPQSEFNYFNSNGQAVYSISFAAIPEPMTMGLLALGALFLRKK